MKQVYELDVYKLAEELWPFTAWGGRAKPLGPLWETGYLTVAQKLFDIMPHYQLSNFTMQIALTAGLVGYTDKHDKLHFIERMPNV